MRAGDLVRFREILTHGAGLHQPTVYTKWKIGLLVEYKPWMKIAQILYEGKEYKIRANDVQIHKQAKRR
jgi:hypothetical protein